MISKPGLMRSVCEENLRLEKDSEPNGVSGDNRLRLEHSQKARRQGCSCRVKLDNTNLKSSRKRFRLELRPNYNWKIMFETESFSHRHGCPLFANSVRTTAAKLYLGSCGALLAGAIEASISITRGAGGSAISSGLRCTRVVSNHSAAFRLVRFLPTHLIKKKSDLDALLGLKIQRLEHLFRSGKASPWDIDRYGNTLLHVRIVLIPMSNH